MAAHAKTERRDVGKRCGVVRLVAEGVRMKRQVQSSKLKGSATLQTPRTLREKVGQAPLAAGARLGAGHRSQRTDRTRRSRNVPGSGRGRARSGAVGTRLGW